MSLSRAAAALVLLASVAASGCITVNNEPGPTVTVTHTVTQTVSGDEGQRAPNVSFNKDSIDDSVTVVQADSGLIWADFRIGGNCAPTTSFSSTDAVSAGDVIRCSESSGTLTVVHVPTNSLVYSTTFT